MHDPLIQKMDMLAFIKIKTLVLWQTVSIWEKIISIHTTDKDLISRIYKEHVKLNSRKTNIPIRQWQKAWADTSTKTAEMVNKRMRKYWIHLAIWCSVAQLCPTLRNPMDCSTPGFWVFHYLLEFAQTHAHRVSGAINHLILCHLFSSCLQSFPAS